MTKLEKPYYDPEKTYQENLDKGPFGAFADASTGSGRDIEGEPKYEIFRHKIYLPFGIPAGPLPNEKFTTSAFRKGFDICVYKTVRTRAHPTHEWPNIVPVEAGEKLSLEKANEGLIQADDYSAPIAITNSFGVGSLDPDEWQPDMKRAVQNAGEGQLLIGSFQGTNRGEGTEKFLEDNVLGAKLVKDTGAKVIEMNLSCPNEGLKNILCFDTDSVLKISSKIKEEIGDTPLLLKMAYFRDESQLEDFVKKLGNIVDGFSAINTIAAPVTKKDGSQALPGEGRAVSGVCGAPIKWAGLEMVERLAKLRDELDMSYVITGVGGVTTPHDFFEYLEAGADIVMSGTGSMWNPYLAQEIKATFNS